MLILSSDAERILPIIDGDYSDRLLALPNDARQSLGALQAVHAVLQSHAEGASAARPEEALAALFEGSAPNVSAHAASALSVAAPARSVDRIVGPVKRRARARIKAFTQTVKAVKSGRFGLAPVWSQGEAEASPRLTFVYTLDARALAPGDLQRKFQAGAVAKAAWLKAKPILERKRRVLAREWKRLEEEKESDIVQAAEKIARIRAAAAAKRVQAGVDLQAWGLPNVAAIGHEDQLKYLRIYRLGGQPTDLGLALHRVLSPLVKKDPKILARITQQGYDAAIRELAQSLRYRMDPETDDSRKTLRLGALVDEGHDYPQWRKAFEQRASKALTQTGPRMLPKAGFGLRPLERQPVPVLRSALNAALSHTKALLASKASPRRVKSAVALVEALHSVLALPLGPRGFQPVRHKQLLTLLPNLKAMGVHEDVLTAVVRSYPLGESLWRLGIPKLWDRGLTGKGVKVAVIDSGVVFAHPDFQGVKRKSVNLTRDAGDHMLGEHGTAMANIVHAIAPGATILSYQAVSNTDLPGVTLSMEETDAAIMKALDLAEKAGAHIISMSLGWDYGTANNAMAKRIAQLRKKGIVVVVAAGNSGDSMPLGLQVNTPGSAPAAITVGAVDYHGRRAEFSSRGPIFNPGNPNDLKDKPDLYAFGVNNKLAMALPASLYNQEPVPYDYMSGTSPATPHVAAVVALMLEAARLAGLPLEGSIAGVVKSALLSTADRLASRPDLPAIPVLLDAQAAVDAFLKKLE